MSFRDKRGGVGNFMVMYVATIAIVVILFIFVLGSGLIKRISDVDDDVAGGAVSIYNESRTGLTNVFDYALNYRKFVEAKFLIEGGFDLDVALVEVKYEK